MSRRKKGASPARFLIGGLLLFFAAAFARPALLQEQDTRFYVLAAVAAGIILLGSTTFFSRMLSQDRILLVVSLSFCLLTVLTEIQTDFDAGLSCALSFAVALLLMVAGSLFCRVIRPSLWFSLAVSVPTVVLLIFPLLTNAGSLPLCFVAMALLMISFVTLLSARYELFAMLLALSGTALFLIQGNPAPALVWSITFLLLFLAYSGHPILLLCSAAGVGVLIFLFSGLFSFSETNGPFAAVNPGWVGLDMSDPFLASLRLDMSVFFRITVRYGWIFAACVLLFYPVIILRGSALARASRSRFQGMLAMGSILLTGFTAVAAILSEFGIWPIPGLSLPGLTGNISFLCVEFFLMGLLGGVSVCNKANLEEDAHLAMLAD